MISTYVRSQGNFSTAWSRLCTSVQELLHYIDRKQEPVARLGALGGDTRDNHGNRFLSKLTPLSLLPAIIWFSDPAHFYHMVSMVTCNSAPLQVITCGHRNHVIIVRRTWEGESHFILQNPIHQSSVHLESEPPVTNGRGNNAVINMMNTGVRTLTHNTNQNIFQASGPGRQIGAFSGFFPGPHNADRYIFPHHTTFCETGSHVT